ncbi:Dynamin central domain-containing protein, partial [Phaeosphaeriaceae sp. PMI808]
FSTAAPWTDLKRDHVGIHALKSFLGGLLHDHIKSEFPDVVRDIERLCSETQQELQILGPSRQTSQDQRRFLTRIASMYQQGVTDALSGSYDPEISVDSPLKLRMHIRELNDGFAEAMARDGHARVFRTVEDSIDQDFARSSVSNDDIYGWIKDNYRHSRGVELPGTVNPIVLESLFRQQSSPWKEVATTYVERVMAAIHKFNKSILLRLIFDSELRQKLEARLSQHERKAQIEADEQLSTILNDERGGILQTVNHYYADTLDAVRQER